LKKNLQWIKSASTWETPVFKQWKALESNTNIKPADNVSMATDFGEKSDACIFGTFENCVIPDFCIDFLWKEPHSGYLLTHQILFHYMIVQNNCFSGEKRILYESQNLTEPKQFIETLCRHVLPESMLIESLNYPNHKQDLFVEQILVCSLAGYSDFLTRNWTNVVFSWTGADGTLGCYAPKSKSKTSLNQRVKRWDNMVKLGNQVCSVHMGALILGVVGQKLRYFLEMCYDS